jgi:hypothetical protein
MCVIATGFGLAQDNVSPDQLPPGTNPTGRVIYPSEGQSNEQQMQDQLECYRWATQQTGFDPYEAYDVLVEKGYVSAEAAEQTRGGAVRGAARGALVGVAVGAIAGDAGKGAAIGAASGGLAGGMRSRRKRQALEAEMERAIDQFKRDLETWDRNYSACMQGRGYGVS